MLDACPGDAVALLAEDGLVLYDELADGVHFLVEQLAKVGVVEGTRVALAHGEGVRAVIALGALAALGATVVRMDGAHADRTVDGVHFVMADITVEHVLEAYDEIPILIADEYAVVRTGRPVAGRIEECYSESAWKDAERLNRDGVIGASSIVTVAESVSAPESVAVLLAAWSAGATVALHDPICVRAAPWAVAARLAEDEVTVVTASASYIESLVSTGALGLVPIPSLTDIAIVSGRISDIFRGVLAAALPTVQVAHCDRVALVCA
nr:AMP-binding protein [Rhodococcus sp. 15-1154-1]